MRSTFAPANPVISFLRVFVGQLDEDVEVAVDDLIGTRRAQERSGNLKPLDRCDLIVAANRLACFGEQHAALCRILREHRLPWCEHRQKHHR